MIQRRGVRMFFVAAVICLMGTWICRATCEETDTRVYEMRTYYVSEGKLEVVTAQFRDHMLKLFEKHGIESIGYWTPVDNPDRKLINLLAFPSDDARTKSWQSFQADPACRQVRDKLESACKLYDKKVETIRFTAADYSPPIQPAAVGDRIFELRTYTATPGNLDRLNARFRNHTARLFARHGITSVAYFTLQPEQPGAVDTLMYLLSHESVEAAAASFDAFRQDPEWIAARTASEKEAGGSLTTPNGVSPVFLQATDFSPTR